jgi:hypothetical protein
MKRLAVVVAVLVGLVATGCKRGDRAAAGCKDSCDRRERERAAVRKDIDNADRAATFIEEINIRDDAQAQTEGQRALQLCDEVRTTLAHARGIGWAIDDEEREIGQKGGRTGVLFDQTNPFTAVEKLASSCHGDTITHAPPLSPAQLKANLVPKVHALKGSYTTNASCAATCEQAK